jgi:hypothetical protein
MWPRVEEHPPILIVGMPFDADTHLRRSEGAIL